MCNFVPRLRCIWSQFSGAGSGIGRATCEVLAREGASVVAADRNFANANETVKQLKTQTPEHLSLEIDVASKTSVNAALNEVLKAFRQPPSIIVNSAGITRDNFLLKLSEQDFEDVMNVNLKVSLRNHKNPLLKLFS